MFPKISALENRFQRTFVFPGEIFPYSARSRRNPGSVLYPSFLTTFKNILTSAEGRMIL